MSIGRFFGQRGEFQHLQKTNEGGVIVETWTTYETVRGRLRPLSGDERTIGQRDTSESTHRWYCRRLDEDITTADRLVVDGRIYNIVFVADPMSMGRHLQIDVRLVESEQA